MDSRAVNKLIRSEVWPILRNQGFSNFSSRTAWRYREPFIDVVNFQSFSSHLAGGIGCTTYSFGLNLGVYVLCGDGERWVKPDSTGGLMPREYDCPFRAKLQKRSSIDGFDRADIFYVDPDGNTIGPVISEAQSLLREASPSWFATLDTVEAAIGYMENMGEGSWPDGLHPTFTPGSRSPAGNDLLATLRLHQYTKAPSADLAATVQGDIDRVAGSILDFVLLGLTPLDYEAKSRRVRDLVHRTGQIISTTMPALLRDSSRLLGASWEPTKAESPPARLISARLSLWPHLRREGFKEFTERAAFRPTQDAVQVVTFAPLSTYERKRHRLPEGTFCVGVGVYWPLLSDGSLPRANRSAELRPEIHQCHLQMWLTSEPASSARATVFTSADTALRALTADGLVWLALCEDTEALSDLLKRRDLEILTNYPLMRGLGSCHSVERHLLRALLDFKQGRGEQQAHQIEAAYEAATTHHEQRLTFLNRWIAQVAENLR